MANTTKRRRLSEAERADHRQGDGERLERAARELLTSEGWQRWIEVRSRAGLVRQSPSYQRLVALTRPDATFIAGFKELPSARILRQVRGRR